MVSASLREGLSEMTINRLGLPPPEEVPGLLIDSTHSGVRQKTRRVTNWKNGAMALRWAAASFVETEKSYRRIIVRPALDAQGPATMHRLPAG